MTLHILHKLIHGLLWNYQIHVRFGLSGAGIDFKYSLLLFLNDFTSLNVKLIPHAKETSKSICVTGQNIIILKLKFLNLDWFSISSVSKP